MPFAPPVFHRQNQKWQPFRMIAQFYRCCSCFCPFFRSELKSLPKKIPSEIRNQIICYLFVFPIFIPFEYDEHAYLIGSKWKEVIKIKTRRVKMVAMSREHKHTMEYKRLEMWKLCSGTNSGSNNFSVSRLRFSVKQHKLNNTVHLSVYYIE